MITFDSWKAFFPNLADTSEEVFNTYLEYAKLEMGTIESRWLIFYDMAQRYLVAHFIVQSLDFQDGGGATSNAPISDRNVDDVIVGYAIAKQNLADINTLLLTAYGQEYVRLRRKAFAGPRVA